MSKFVKEWMPYIIIVVVVMVIRTFIVTPVVVRGDSMFDTLKDGEVLFLSKIQYRISSIERYDIVVIKDTDGDLIIKRVIGLPSEKIWYRDNSLYVNNKVMEESFSEDKTEDFTLDEICSINGLDCSDGIPEGYYLVLGDNRDVSADSRIKGLIQEKQILGKAVFRIWPFSKIGQIGE